MSALGILYHIALLGASEEIERLYGEIEVPVSPDTTLSRRRDDLTPRWTRVLSAGLKHLRTRLDPSMHELRVGTPRAPSSARNA